MATALKSSSYFRACSSYGTIDMLARQSATMSRLARLNLTGARLTASSLLARPALSQSVQRRVASTTVLSQDESQSLLREQRKRRPNSPHLTIYAPQLTWYLSAFNRITGCAVSGGLYVFGAAYLVSPLLGWHLDSASIAAAFGSLSVASKFLIKSAIALPFTFHSWNGIRHLVWDTASELTLKGVYRTGYTVLGLTAVSTIALALL